MFAKPVSPVLSTLVRSRPDGGRVFRGGRVNDAGRLPRYALLFALAAAGLWAPIVAYVKLTPPSFTSEVSLILPGSGAQSSVNLADLGQASSSSASAFSSSRISPTQTYKRLLSANRTLEKAAEGLGIARSALGAPRIKLVDETSLIHFEMTGGSPEEAQARSYAVLTVFLDELDALREDELLHREAASRRAIAGYEDAVSQLRGQIADLQAESGLLSYEHYTSLVAERDALQAKLENARSRNHSADAEVKALSAQLQVSPKAAATNLRLHADPEFQELASAYATQASVLAEAQGRFGRRHPKVTSAAQALAGAKNDLALRGMEITGSEIDLTLARLDLSPSQARSALLSDLVAQVALSEGLSSAVQSLEEQLELAEARLAWLAPKAALLDDLSRDHKVAETVFGSALARSDTTKAEVYASYPLVQVLADASLPENATSPKPLIAIAAGVAATLMVLAGLGLAWARRPLIEHLLLKGDT